MSSAFPGLIYLIGYMHRVVSGLVITAVSVSAVHTFVGAALNLWLPTALVHRGWTASQVGIAFAVRGIVQSIISAGAWALVVVAIFAERRDPPPVGSGSPP